MLEAKQWMLVGTDGSAKQVRGWLQADYGAWFGEADQRNVALPVPATERQSVSMGELHGFVHALQRPRAGEKMLVVLDSEYVYEGQVASSLPESEVA